MIDPTKKIVLFFCLLTVISLNACAINRETAQVSPDIYLEKFKKFYVVKFSSDNRGINRLIMDQLLRMGFESNTGSEILAAKDVDVIVTYQDKWRWDITMYMIELTIFFREPGTQKLIALGKSHHTSLSRKSPEKMVLEVLSNIFSKSMKSN